MQDLFETVRQTNNLVCLFQGATSLEKSACWSLLLNA